jgi:uncharacterized GH25 family protein
MQTRKPLLPLLALALFAAPAFPAIRGVVIDTDGAPVAGARIAVYAGESSAARLARLLSEKPERTALSTATADSKGTFTADAKQERAADVTISADGYGSEGLLAAADDDLGTIALRKVAAKGGKIRAGGKPATGTLIVASDTVSRSDDGSYSVNEMDSLTLIRAGSAPTTVSFSQAQKRKFAVDLDAGVRVEGTVVKKDGTPAASVPITVDGWPASSSGTDGHFVIEHAPAQWKEIRAAAGPLWGRATHSAKPLTIRLGTPARLQATAINGATGKAIPFARINTGGRETPLESFVADASGSIDVPLAPGTFDVRGRFPRFTAAGTQAIVKTGETTKVTVVMQPESLIQGTVQDEEKRPVAGAAVYSTADNWNFPTDVSAFTGTDGKFTLHNVTPDTQLIVRATRKGLPPAKSGQLKLAAGERKSGVVLTMPRGFTVNGIVRTAAGKPLGEAEVFLFPTDENLRYMASMLIDRANADHQNVKSAADGTFRTQLTEGRYDAFIRHEGYATASVRAIAVSAKTPLVEVKLEEAVEVSGRVLRAGGAPVVDAFVNVSTAVERVEGSRTGPDGSFTVGGLLAGPVSIGVSKFDEMIQESRNVTAPKSDVVIQLAPGGRVSGRVIDAATKAPVTDFSIGISSTRSMGGRVFRDPPRMRQVHDDDGRFSLEEVPVMTLDIVGSASGYVTKRLPSVKVEEGKPVTDLEVALETGTTLVGKVTGPDGTAIARANIYEDIQGNAVYDSMRTQTFTDGNGEFRLPALEPSERTFRISKEGYAAERKTVKLSGKEQRMDVRLSSGLTVTGSVLTADGAPVAEAEVSASSPMEGWQGAGSLSDEQGNFRLEGLKAGRYQFYARKSGLASGQLEGVTIDGSANPVIIRMAAGGTIVGRVTGLKPAELAFTYIMPMSSGFSVGRIQVDPSGTYRLEGVRAGPGELVAQMMQPGHFRTSERKHVEVTAGSEVTADIDFPEGLIMRGRVTRNGQPMANAYVNFSGTNTKTTSSGMETTDAAGAYEIRGLSPGSHNVGVSDQSRKIQYRTTYEVTSSSTFDIDATGRTVRGRVVDADNDAPLANVVVSLMPKSSRNSFNTSDALTDGTGAFALESVSDGDYVLRASRDGYGHKLLDLNVPSSVSSELAIKLMKSSGLTVRVVDARDGKTINGSVVAWDLNNQLVARANSTSNETYLLSVAPGEYYVAAMIWGYAPQIVRVSAPNPAELRLPVSLGGTLTIETSSKEPRQVKLMRPDGFAFRLSEYAGDGTIVITGTKELEHVTAGSYTLQVLDGKQQVVKTYPVTVTEGAPTKVQM